MREGRPGKHRKLRRGRGFGGDIGHQAAGSSLNPFGTKHQIAHAVGQFGKNASKMLRGGNREHGGQ